MKVYRKIIKPTPLVVRETDEVVILYRVILNDEDTLKSLSSTDPLTEAAQMHVPLIK